MINQYLTYLEKVRNNLKGIRMIHFVRSYIPYSFHFLKAIPDYFIRFVESFNK